MSNFDPTLQSKLTLFKSVDKYVKEKHGKETRAVDTNTMPYGYVTAYLMNGGEPVKVTKEELLTWEAQQPKEEKEPVAPTTTDSHS